MQGLGKTNLTANSGKEEPIVRHELGPGKQIAAELIIGAGALLIAHQTADAGSPAKVEANTTTTYHPDSDYLGFKDFPPHPRIAVRHTPQVASRGEQRPPLAHYHKPEAKPSPTSIAHYGDPRTIGRLLLSKDGFGAAEFSCLDMLWDRESGWDVHAYNSSSGAYGIPQALPGYKMATAGADWHDNPYTQEVWGIDYIKEQYGTPCGALAHSNSYGWY